VPVVGDPPGMAPIAGFGAAQCLRSAAHENLGAHDRHLGENEKRNFGAQAMQNCDSATAPVRRRCSCIIYSNYARATSCIEVVKTWMPATSAGMTVVRFVPGMTVETQCVSIRHGRA
jgi:hypothetical protein